MGSPKKKEEFKILDDWESVRTRPGWYVGDVSNAMPLVKEILDNALDEFQKGYADKVCLKLDPKHGHIIADNSSKGFPLDEAVLPNGKPAGITKMEASVSYLSAGSKFDKDQVQVGANGTGSTVVNFLSKEYVMAANLTGRKSVKFPKRTAALFKKKPGRFYYLKFKDGKKSTEGFTDDLSGLGLKGLEEYSTIIRFIPDSTLIDSPESPVPESLQYIMKVAEIKQRKLTVIVNGKDYKSPLKSFKHTFNIVIPGHKNSRNPQIELLGSFELSGDIFTGKTIGSVNGAITPKGKHIDLFRQEFQNAMQETFGRDADGLECNGINLFLVLRANEVDFRSQEKTVLSRIPEFEGDRMYLLKRVLIKIMKENQEEFQEYYAKLVNFRLKKGELNQKQKINTILGTDIQDDSLAAKRRAGSYLPSKLMDAYSENRQDCELFLVEGLSAASDFQKYRDPKIHAVLPLRGVPLNACNANVESVLSKSQELRDMVKGIGSGVDANHNLKKLRYGKIIITTDGDPDGQRIAALLCGMFGAHMRYLLDNKSVYMIVSPYYIQNDKFYYPGEWDKLDHNKPFKRIKGLGSLGKYFYDAILNPKKRKLIRITSEGAASALMILTNTSRRKELLIESGALKEDGWKGEEKSE